MKVTLVMTSGKELDFECKSAEVKKTAAGDMTGITFEGLVGRMFLYIRLSDIVAVVYDDEEAKQSDV